MILELCECQMSLFINSVLYMRRRDRHRGLMKNRLGDVKERFGTTLEWSASICTLIDLLKHGSEIVGWN